MLSMALPSDREDSCVFIPRRTIQVDMTLHTGTLYSICCPRLRLSLAPVVFVSMGWGIGLPTV